MPGSATRSTTNLPRRLRAEDLLQLRTISEAQISPDGDRICYAQTVIDREENKYRSHLWMLHTEGGDPQPFTTGEQMDTRPAWSPDGRQIAFLSTRSGTTGGAPRDVTACFDRPLGDLSLGDLGAQGESVPRPTRPSSVSRRWAVPS